MVSSLLLLLETLLCGAKVRGVTTDATCLRKKGSVIFLTQGKHAKRKVRTLLPRLSMMSRVVAHFHFIDLQRAHVDLLECKHVSR